MNPLATIARPAGRKACRRLPGARHAAGCRAQGMPRLPGVSHAGRVIAPTGSAMIASREAIRASALASFMFALAIGAPFVAINCSALAIGAPFMAIKCSALAIGAPFMAPKCSPLAIGAPFMAIKCLLHVDYPVVCSFPAPPQGLFRGPRGYRDLARAHGGMIRGPWHMRQRR